MRRSTTICPRSKASKSGSLPILEISTTNSEEPQYTLHMQLPHRPHLRINDAQRYATCIALVRPILMPPRRNKKTFLQLTEFEWTKIIGFLEGGHSNHGIGARMQRNSSTVMQVFKQWTDEPRTTRKTGGGK
ncbi:uncharacterized protein TNCV_3790311 [Trichonephila clavipes]|nr:uncharacterized protein TNCV_3790311 [Trichonephila clavipes]